MRSLQTGIEVCVTVTLLDGLVLARTAFHHSMNYRSVVLLGTATTVQDADQKLEALKAFTEHIVPGRWAEVRQPTPQELIVTSVLKLPLSEASAKVRTGPPDDEEELIATTPIADSCLPQGITLPSYLHNYTRNRSR